MSEYLVLATDNKVSSISACRLIYEPMNRPAVVPEIEHACRLRFRIVVSS